MQLPTPVTVNPKDLSITQTGQKNPFMTAVCYQILLKQCKACREYKSAKDFVGHCLVFVPEGIPIYSVKYSVYVLNYLTILNSFYRNHRQVAEGEASSH